MRVVSSGLAALAVVFGAGSPAWAESGFSIGPLSLEISPRTRIAVLQVGNFRSTPLDLQASVVSWSQRTGQDKLTPTDDIVVSPAIASVPPGKRQVFRVAFRGVPSPEREQAFRLMVADVSPPPLNAGAGATVAFRITNSLPLFVRATMKGAPQLEVGSCAAPEHQACVEIRNPGVLHAKVRRIVMNGQGWTQTLTPNATVLAGGKRSFTTPIGQARPGHISVQVEADGATVSGDLDAGAR